MQETKGLYAEISVLKQLLLENGIKLPEQGSLPYSQLNSSPASPPNAFDLSIRPLSTKNKQQHIHVQAVPSHIHYHLHHHERAAPASNFSHRKSRPYHRIFDRSNKPSFFLIPNRAILIRNSPHPAQNRQRLRPHRPRHRIRPEVPPLLPSSTYL
jgi:hypothetical protein